VPPHRRAAPKPGSFRFLQAGAEVLEGETQAARRLLPDLQPLMGSEDVKEDVASFLERREANFAGR
jgi:enoyl-CoA hydratase